MISKKENYFLALSAVITLYSILRYNHQITSEYQEIVFFLFGFILLYIYAWNRNFIMTLSKVMKENKNDDLEIKCCVRNNNIVSHAYIRNKTQNGSWYYFDNDLLLPKLCSLREFEILTSNLSTFGHLRYKMEQYINADKLMALNYEDIKQTKKSYRFLLLFSYVIIGVLILLCACKLSSNELDFYSTFNF